MRSSYRHTKVIFTIGPATDDEETLEKLVRAGVDICRFNMAHATHDYVRDTVARLRKVCEKVERHVSVMVDIKGPEIRTGVVPYALDLEPGNKVDFYVNPDDAKDLEQDGAYAITVNYPGLAKDVVVGNTVLVDSGLIRMKILSKDEKRVRCEVLTPGPLGNRRHINLPGVKVNLPCLTEKDKNDIKLSIECNVEFFALSFAREADDLRVMRRFIAEHDSQAHIIAKIEDQSAVSNLDAIVDASDGLMVARGDLGIEIPYEDLPVVQRRAVQTCHRQGKPVIIATHMLESMISSPMPTRAEITDVANAVYEQADCVMLSGETTIGKYPVECVEVLNRIIRKTELGQGPLYNENVRLITPKAKMLRSAVVLASDMAGAPIVVFTRRGQMAQILSSLRPRNSPVYAFTSDNLVFKQMLPLWGIEPFLLEFDDDPEETVQKAFKALLKYSWVRRGDNMVVITNSKIRDRFVDTIQIRVVE